MANETIVIECIDGVRQLPEGVKKNLEEIANLPIGYSRDCPLLTDKEISEFRHVADLKYDKKTKTNQPVSFKKCSR